ncbi:MAG: cytochrome c [Saprospiraceae bacterium]|nr:cytochrome c [Saprospiraceae bacterium]
MASKKQFFNLSYFIILLICFDACKKDEPIFQNINHQDFFISCNRDTTLVSSEGVRIIIKANTFQCVSDHRVHVQFAAILDKSDMVLNRVYTIDRNGDMLESGGMFQIQDITTGADVFNKPIQLLVPANPKYLNFNMAEYQLAKIDGISVWARTSNTARISKGEGALNGKELFKQNCASCHNAKLRDKLTGPALGNVHLFRSKQWLRDFTKDSQALIAKGDSTAICLWYEWNKSVMTGFKQLTDNDIDQIYEYIANQSRVMEIGQDEIKYETECDLAKRISKYDSFGVDTSIVENYTIDTNSMTYRYELALQTKNWANIDYLLNVYTRIDPITVMLDKSYENTSMALVFQNRNIVVPFYQRLESDGKFVLLNSIGKQQINFPIDEKIWIVAFSEASEFRYKVEEYTTKKVGNNLKFSLDSMSKEQFIQELKKL